MIKLSTPAKIYTSLGLILVLFIFGLIINNIINISQIRSSDLKTLDTIINNVSQSSGYSLSNKSIALYKSTTTGCMTDLPCKLNRTEAIYSFNLVDKTREEVYRELLDKLDIQNKTTQKQFDQHFANSKSQKYPGTFHIKTFPYALSANDQKRDNECQKIDNTTTEDNCRYEVFKSQKADRVELIVQLYH